MMNVKDNNSAIKSLVSKTMSDRMSKLSFTGNVSFILKRTTRVVAALFLVTNLLSDTNPIGHKIRSSGVDLIAFVVSSLSTFSDDEEQFLRSYSSQFLNIVSILEVSFISGQISEMNFKLISMEIDRLVFDVEQLYQNVGPLVQESKIGDLLLKGVVGKGGKNPYPAYQSSLLGGNLVKGHKKKQKKRKMSYRMTDSSSQGPSLENEERENRKNSILNILKDGQHLSIKDFLNVIPGVSEKTIQRELTSLVTSGVLKREGERRWSRYFLETELPKPENVQ